jgi:CheY-like chemotaxis protein
VDDEPQIQRFLHATLEVHQYDVSLAATAAAALEQVASWRPDLVLLDLGLPDISGLEVIRRLREWSDVPIIVLSVRDREDDKVAALNLGADDYLIKPSGTNELKAALNYIRKGDTLVVWKLDRLARLMRRLIETVEDLQAHSIELRSLTESIETATPGGRLVFHIFGALAEFERAVIRERTSAGLQAARERGKKGGRPKTFPQRACRRQSDARGPRDPRGGCGGSLEVSPAPLCSGKRL